MRRKYIFLALSVVFILINCILIGIDKQNTKVDRISYMKQWTSAQKRTLHEAFKTNGVVTYADESDVYFDKSLGTFKEFLVEQGQNVHSGDKLFSYYVNDYNETKNRLQQQADELESKIQAIDAAIGKVGGTASSPEPNRSVDNLSNNGRQPRSKTNTNLEQFRNEVRQADSSQAKLLQKQFIAEQEKERDQKQAEQKSLQSQISTLSASGDTVTVESPFSGRVTNISKALNDPLLTIQDPDQLQISGYLNEKERLKTKEGMSAKANLQESKDRLSGLLEKVSNDPEKIKLIGQSMYPFYMTLDNNEKTDALLPGYHANVEILTKEAAGATTIADNALFKDSVWLMDANGRLQYIKVKTGIKEKQFAEINTNNIKPGDWLAVSPKEHFYDKAVFITPLKISNVTWRGLQDDKRSNLKYFLTGILAR